MQTEGHLTVPERELERSSPSYRNPSAVGIGYDPHRSGPQGVNTLKIRTHHDSVIPPYWVQAKGRAVAGLLPNDKF